MLMAVPTVPAGQPPTRSRSATTSFSWITCLTRAIVQITLVVMYAVTKRGASPSRLAATPTRYAASASRCAYAPAHQQRSAVRETTRALGRRGRCDTPCSGPGDLVQQTWVTSATAG